METKKFITCAEWAANAIAESGCSVVYGGHGGALVPLVDAIVSHPKLKWVYTRNEANASLMAAAHAKFTGGLGCCIATSGPGATNLTTGLLDAMLDRVPVLCLTGTKPREGMGYSEFQDVDQSRLFSGGGLHFSHTVASPDAFLPLLRDGIASALTSRTCVHMAVPVDVQAAMSPLPQKHFCASHANIAIKPRSIDCEILDAIVKTLRSEELNRIVIGVGTEARGAGPAILRLAEELHAPILTRLDGKGVVDELHPLAWGVIGVHGKPGLESAATIIESSQLVICIGVTDPTPLVADDSGLQTRRLITVHRDALMVTARYNPLHTILGDITQVCQGLVERLEADDNTPNEPVADRLDFERNRNSSFAEDKTDADILWGRMHDGEWRSLLRAQYHVRYGAASEDGIAGFCHPASVVKQVSGFLANINDAVLCVDTGDVTLWAGLCISRTAGITLSSEHLGTMGYSICAGIASILAQPPGATAVVIVGDGGFQMTCNELAVFKQHKREGDLLLLVVLDNKVLGRVFFGFSDAKGCEIEGPDYVQLSHAYGGDGMVVTSNDQVKAALREANARRGLFIVHARTDPSIKADMAKFHVVTSNRADSG